MELVALAPEKKQIPLTAKQLQLIFKGLGEEWRGMDIYNQCLTIFT